MVEEVVMGQKLRKLWLTVLNQAVSEAEGEKLWGIEEEVKRGWTREGYVYRARKWLATCSRDLQSVGYMGGLTGEQIKLLVERNKEKYGG